MNRRRMNEKDAIVLAGVLGAALLLLFSPLWGPMIWKGPEMAVQPKVSSGPAVREDEKEQKEEQKPVEKIPIVNEVGMTLAERINSPDGYQRIETKEGSFAWYVRNYNLKKSTGVVKLWDGTKKQDQSGVQAVFKLPMAKENLQWAAGTVMRLYGEYLWTNRQFDKLCFQFRDGFKAEYTKWREGFRIRSDATGTIWVNGGELNESRENFEEYMHAVLTYTSAGSLEKETKKVKKAEIQTGDIFLNTATAGDAAIIVDVCMNEAGQKAFLLAKGGSPAEQFHLLKNPAHEEDPWYYEEELTYPFVTSEGTFEKGSLRHPVYLD